MWKYTYYLCWKNNSIISLAKHHFSICYSNRNWVATQSFGDKGEDKWLVTSRKRDKQELIMWYLWSDIYAICNDININKFNFHHSSCSGPYLLSFHHSVCSRPSFLRYFNFQHSALLRAYILSCTLKSQTTNYETN